MKKLTVLLSAILTTASFATTFQFDDVRTKNADEKKSCGLDKFEIDLKESFDRQVINELGGKLIDLERIENSKSSMIVPGGEPYTGDVRVTSYIVKSDGFGAYKPFIADLVRIEKYYSGSGKIKGFILEKSLLNHLNSAELGEDAHCTDMFFKRVN